MGEMSPDEPSDRDIIRALWDESTCKPVRNGEPWTPVGGLLSAHAQWAVAEFGAAETCRIWGWSTGELDGLTGRCSSVRIVRAADPPPKGWVPVELVCGGCDRTFTTTRWGQKHCSSTCRRRFSLRQANTRIPYPPTV